MENLDWDGGIGSTQMPKFINGKRVPQHLGVKGVLMEPAGRHPCWSPSATGAFSDWSALSSITPVGEISEKVPKNIATSRQATMGIAN